MGYHYLEGVWDRQKLLQSFCNQVSALCDASQELQWQEVPTEQQETRLQSNLALLQEELGYEAAGKLPSSFIPKEEKLKPVQARNSLP